MSNHQWGNGSLYGWAEEPEETAPAVERVVKLKCPYPGCHYEVIGPSHLIAQLALTHTAERHPSNQRVAAAAFDAAWEGLRNACLNIPPGQKAIEPPKRIQLRKNPNTGVYESE